MTPFDQAFRWHHQHGGDVGFSEVIEAHAQVGVVIITPELFLLGRRVFADWPEARRNHLWSTAEDGDCWHVWLAAGDWRLWEKFLPYPLPWVSMHRRGKLRVWALDGFRRLKWRGEGGGADAAGNGQQG